MKSGFIALVGRPNVGKSTLLNAIMGKKVAITSNKPQTTRNLIQGIYNDDDSQIVFVDTPGIHKPKHKLGKILNKQTYLTFNDVDIILFLVDITEELGKGDKFVIDLFQEKMYNKIKSLEDTNTIVICNSSNVSKYKKAIPYGYTE